MVVQCKMCSEIQDTHQGKSWLKVIQFLITPQKIIAVSRCKLYSIFLLHQWARSSVQYKPIYLLDTRWEAIDIWRKLHGGQKFAAVILNCEEALVLQRIAAHHQVGKLICVPDSLGKTKLKEDLAPDFGISKLAPLRNALLGQQILCCCQNGVKSAHPTQNLWHDLQSSWTPNSLRPRVFIQESKYIPFPLRLNPSICLVGGQTTS